MKPRRLTGAELVQIVAERTGYAFADPALLVQALTHSSVRDKVGADNERLEFLGDRVLALLVTEMLFELHRDAEQGELAVRLSALVSGDACAAVADEIGVADLINADAALRKQTGRKARNVRADAMEALIAAIYLDGGMSAARQFITRFWRPRAELAAVIVRDPKTELQEWLAQRDNLRPAYAIVGRDGPDHEPVFTVELAVVGFAAITGTGRSKQAAEQDAAAAFLLREGVRSDAGRDP